MRPLASALTGIVLALFVGEAALRAADIGAGARPAPVPAAPHARGILWRIDGAGAKPSYLFGTIHLADPRVTALPAPVHQAFDGARHFVMELVADADGVMQLAQAMMFQDGRTLADAVGAELYTDVEAAFRRRGMPTAALALYKPWAVTVILSMPTPNGDMPLDMRLQQAAADQGKTVEGLETAREQIAVFDGLAPADQRALLQATLREQHKLEQQVEALVLAYLARDLVKLQALTQEHDLEDGELHATVMNRLLASRNRRMVERMRARLRQGNAFIAVGAAHLVGPEGILELLERDGYRVRAVY